MLRYQRSVSVDEPSPSGSEHEKWEREAMQENIWKGQHRAAGKYIYILMFAIIYALF